MCCRLGWTDDPVECGHGALGVHGEGHVCVAPMPPSSPPFAPMVSFSFDFSSANTPGWSNTIMGSLENGTYALTRTSSGTPSPSTGPFEGPGGPGSFYYYAEASAPRVEGDRFEVTASRFEPVARDLACKGLVCRSLMCPTALRFCSIVC